MKTKFAAPRALIGLVLGAFATLSAGAYTSSSYKQKGLIAQWDAIDNTFDGSGKRVHDAAATVWKDLTGNGHDFNLASYVGNQLQNPCWSDKALLAKGVYQIPAASSASGYVTIEICAKHNNKYQCLFNSGDGLNKFCAVKNGTVQFYNAASQNYAIGDATYLQAAAVHSPNVSAPAVYVFGEPAKQTQSDTWGGNSNGTCLGRGANSYQFDGEYYAIRLYDHALTATEIACHRKIDGARFLGEFDSASELTVTGSPSEESFGGLPAYGTTSDHTEGESIALTAPPCFTNGNYIAICKGWRRFEYDVSEQDYVQVAASASDTILDASFAFGTRSAKVEWQWAYAYRYAPAVSGDGDITTSSPAGWYAAGETTTLTATPKPGYRFAGWAGDVPSACKTNNPLELVIGTAPVSVTAIFEVDAVQKAVYLKADATGCETGTSWENAYTSVSNAIYAAVAKGLPLYVAQGVYCVPATIPLPKGYKIYGGFPGMSMDETPADRDRNRYQTIFTGDRDLDDVWIHRVPNTSYGFTSTTLSEKVIVNGRINEPPAFTEDHDVYSPSLVGSNTSVAFTGTASNGLMDGVIISGFTAPGSGATGYAVVNLVSASGGVYDFNDCRFVGNSASYGMIYNAVNNGVNVRNCDLTYNWGTFRGAGLAQHSSYGVITNCTFLSLARTSADAGMVLNAWGGNAITVRNSRIVRCAQASGNSWQTSYGGAGAIFSGESGGTCYLYDTVISNNYAATSSAVGASFFSGRGTTYMKHCLFANNLVECKVQTAGRAYTMFGNSGSEEGKAYRSFEATTFANNKLRAREVTISSDGYALGIVGNHQQGSDSILLNCTFVSNKVETLVEKANVKPVFCRGLLTYAPSSAKIDQAGLANCTFYGPADGQYDVMQWGAGHTKVLNLVNCVFECDADAQPSPVYMDVPSLVNFSCCSILNKLSTDGEACAYEGLQSDKIPFVFEMADSSNGRYVLRPDANVPGLRATCDVATNNNTSWNWVFRKPGETAWQALAPALAGLSGSGFDKRLVDDATGVARPAGAFTRGAVQTLTPNAENGASVVLRREPFAACLFDKCASQSAAAGADIAPVTAENRDAKLYKFDGWYQTDGTRYATSAKLTGAFPAGTTVLTAKFTAPDVDVVLSLDGAGTFTETGTDSVTLTCQPGSVFPPIPAYTLDPKWHGLPFVTPPFVAATNAVYALPYVSSAVRIIHVVPASEAPAVQDGKTWETAYTDIATAYADAGLYRGEVWIKEGRYVIGTPIAMTPNVAIRGGFAGDETEASAADPAAHPTIITGDVGANDYWRPNNKTDAKYNTDANRIWTEEEGVWTYHPPAPDYTQFDYVSPGGNNSDNAPNFLFNASGVATNNVLNGLTLTGFRGAVIDSSSAMASGLTLRNCRLLANNTECVSSVEMGGAIRIIGSETLIEDCEFEGNWYPISVNAPASTKLIVVGTAFKYGSAGTYGAAIRTHGSFCLVATNCWFYRNWQGAAGGQGAAALALRSTATHLIDSCRFEENRNTGDSHGTICFSSGNSNANFTRCKFVGNRVNNTGTYENSRSCCIAYYNGAGAVLVKDCLFQANDAYSTTSQDGVYLTTAIAAYGGNTTVLNCSFVANTNKASSVTSLNNAGTIAGNCNVGIVNCSFRDSVITGDNAAEINVKDTPTFGLVNCVFDTVYEPATYRPFRNLNAAQQISLANVYARNFDATQFAGLAANGYCTNVWTGGDYAFKGKRLVTDGTVEAMPAGSRFARLARPIWLVGSVAYFCDPLANASKPWRKTHNRGESYATVTGLTLETPCAADALGKARRRHPRADALGPVHADPLGFAIKIR